MSARLITEETEKETLSPFAAKSAFSAGRARKELPCVIRTDFQRDRDRITHSKSFRRLMHKTQVFISPEGDHYRTRLTHTLEVTQISRTIARALRLNEDLTEAVALGHDLGHTPFGHTGEDALNALVEGGFRHNEQSVRVVTRLENNGRGLNLTAEVLNGIENHRGAGRPATLEAKIVQLSDKIAYINHDIDDAIRAKVLNPSDLPQPCRELLGERSSDRIDYLIKNTIQSSMGKNEILIDDEARAALTTLRAYLFETIYQSQLQQKERVKIKHMLSVLFAHYSRAENLPPDYKRMIDADNPPWRVACDYIAGMTDRFAMNQFIAFYVPSAWHM